MSFHASEDPAPNRLLVRSAAPMSGQAVASLERRLAAFYQGNADYYDCASEADKSAFFRPVADIARSIAVEKGRVRILEIGAGKSTLPQYLSRALPSAQIDFVAHDINTTNRPYYDASGIPLLIGDIAEIQIGEPFDLVVSFFVWEHLTRPARCLDRMCALLNPEGRLIIVSPKYTFLFYIPPAIRHLSAIRRLLINTRLVTGSLLTRVSGRPRFSVVVDPAVFHAKWRRDFDAVHMVSPPDLSAHLGSTWRVGKLAVAYGSAKARLLGAAMLLAVIIERRREV